MTVTADVKIEELELVEDEGVYVSLTRKFLVTSISSGFADTRQLSAAMTAAGVPAWGAYAPGNTNLICTGRKVTMLPDSPTTAMVTCSYIPVAQSQATFIFSGGTNLTQTTTQNDILGNQISVSHTFPVDDEDEDYAGKTKVSGANVSVLIPATTLTATGQLFVDYPDAISRYYVGSMNATYWAGTEPGYWMCTGCNFEGLAVGIGQPHLWRFTFIFEHSYVGWPLQTWYVDPRTGDPPADLVPGVGVKDVFWYGEVDFNYLFPNT